MSDKCEQCKSYQRTSKISVGLLKQLIEDKLIPEELEAITKEIIIIKQTEAILTKQVAELQEKIDQEICGDCLDGSPDEYPDTYGWNYNAVEGWHECGCVGESGPYQKIARQVETLKLSVKECEDERCPSSTRADMHAKINKAVSDAIGNDGPTFHGSWHDLGPKVAKIVATRDKAIGTLRDTETVMRNLEITGPADVIAGKIAELTNQEGAADGGT